MSFYLLPALIMGYLIGSIPFGLIITKMAGLGDIRKIGSGNIGATNVLRTGRKDLAFLTLLFDVGKAGLIAILFKMASDSQIIGILAGFSAVVGHNYPVWLSFKGGKGVASTFGLMLTMTPLVGIFSALTWFVMAFTFRYSSLSALVALSLAPVYALFFNDAMISLIYMALALLSLFRHRENIKRIIHGQESKIKLGKK